MTELPPAADLATYQRLQDEAIRGAPPYPADRFAGRGIVMAAGGPRHFTCAVVTLRVLREVLGCTLGRRYIGGGIGIANALTFGRLAGKTAAQDSAAA